MPQVLQIISAYFNHSIALCFHNNWKMLKFVCINFRCLFTIHCMIHSGKTNTNHFRKIFCWIIVIEFRCFQQCSVHCAAKHTCGFNIDFTCIMTLILLAFQITNNLLKFDLKTFFFFKWIANEISKNCGFICKLRFSFTQNVCGIFVCLVKQLFRWNISAENIYNSRTM